MNQEIVSLELLRDDIVDLMTVCTNTARSFEVGSNCRAKWERLHDILKDLLVEFDSHI